MRNTPKFPIAVLMITLLLFIASLVLAFVGAFRSGAGDPLFKTGAAGFLIVPSFGWIMVTIYNRVHKEDKNLNAAAARADEKAAGKEPAEASERSDTEDTK